METILYSDILKLFVVLLAIIAIVFLFLKYRKDDERPKIHMYYISGLCIFIILELVTYICVNNDNATDIVSYISFASTLSSLFLSVVAIIYAIVSNNKGEAQYQKIDRASDKISLSVDKFSTLSENLSGDINAIMLKLEELKVISNETKSVVTNTNKQNPDKITTGTINVDQLISGYITFGSYSGNLALLACVYSLEKRRPFTAMEVFGMNAAYCYGYIIASSALGLITTHTTNEVITVDNVNANIKTLLINQIKLYIASSPQENKDYNLATYENVKRTFGITED
jgi:ABC-type multidrug transport system fused ATPase/permease subunit